MVIFYVYMRERAKKSPFYVAYMHIDEETFACKGKNFANRLTRTCVCYGAKEITALRLSCEYVAVEKKALLATRNSYRKEGLNGQCTVFMYQGINTSDCHFSPPSHFFFVRKQQK